MPFRNFLYERELVDRQPLSDPHEWPIHGTTITLSLQRKPKSRLNPQELLLLLDRLAWLITHAQDMKAPVGGEAFWYPGSEDEDGIRFGLLSAVYLDELTWGDVLDIVRGLREWYKKDKYWLESSFLIYDSERGPLGSGVVRMKEADVTSTA